MDEGVGLFRFVSFLSDKSKSLESKDKGMSARVSDTLIASWLNHLGWVRVQSALFVCLFGCLLRISAHISYAFYVPVIINRVLDFKTFDILQLLHLTKPWYQPVPLGRL